MSSLPCPDHLKLLAFQTLCVINDTTGEVLRRVLANDEALAEQTRKHLREFERALVIAYERGKTGATA